jgi:hypothetical protein
MLLLELADTGLEKKKQKTKDEKEKNTESRVE